MNTVATQTTMLLIGTAVGIMASFYGWGNVAIALGAVAVVVAGVA